MPKSWINGNSDTAEGRSALTADGAQYQSPHFAAPQDDEDIFHGWQAQGMAGPMPCAFSRMETEIAAAEYSGPFCANCRAPEKELGPAPPCFPCYPCRVPDDMDMTPHGTSLVPACFLPPCRISSEPEIVAMPDNRIPPGWGFGRVSDDSDLPVHAAGTEIETAADMEMTVADKSFPPPCFMPCRMSEDREMTALADAIPYPCLPPRMPESLHASSAAQLPPPAYYCRQSR